MRLDITFDLVRYKGGTKPLIEIMESILGFQWGTTSYDDIIAAGALMLGITAILLVINLFKSFITR